MAREREGFRRELFFVGIGNVRFAGAKHMKITL
jgi:hypothetical protein